MKKMGMLITGVILFVAGGALGLFMEFKGWIHVIPRRDVHILQAPNDPPVTVGDGSFHVHSKHSLTGNNKAWEFVNGSNKTKIKALNSADTNTASNPGSFSTAKCSYQYPQTHQNVVASAYLWTDDDKIYDISPNDSGGVGWQVTLTHDDGTTVAITIDGGHLQFASGAAFDDPRNDDQSDLRHGSATRVTSISVQGAHSAGPPWPWNAVSTHPHYTLGFCYQ